MIFAWLHLVHVRLRWHGGAQLHYLSRVSCVLCFRSIRSFRVFSVLPLAKAARRNARTQFVRSQARLGS